MNASIVRPIHRFFISPESISATSVTLSGDVVHQLSRVLRMRAGDEVLLLDGLGSEYLVELVDFGRDHVRGDVLDKRAVNAEPASSVDLYMSLLNKPDKFEWVLQKCTELGVSRFIPISAARSVPGKPEAGRRERWERIIREAAEQSGRGLLPALEETLPMNRALDAVARTLAYAAPRSHVALLPTPGAAASLKEALRPSEGRADTISLFIGPEGGFSEEEVSTAGGCGVTPVSLGPRTLRAETAAVAALSLVLYELGEMGTGRG